MARADADKKPTYTSARVGGDPSEVRMECNRMGIGEEARQNPRNRRICRGFQKYFRDARDFLKSPAQIFSYLCYNITDETPGAG